MMRTRTLTCSLVALGCAASAASETAPFADKVTEGWYLGVPVVLEVQIPRSAGGRGPDQPAGTRAPPLYLIAPIDKSVAFTPDMMIPTPAGERMLPAHQDVLSVCAADTAGTDVDGVFVVMGEQASADTVRVAPLADPRASVPGAALATAMRVGKTWVPLTSHAVIEYGVASRQLRLVPFMFGGRVRAHGRNRILPQCTSNISEQS